jgi:hypothetical protein
MPDTVASDLPRADDPKRKLPPLRRIVRRIGQLSNSRRLLLAEAVYWLGAARVALIAIPFRDLAARFGGVCTPEQAKALAPRKYSESDHAIAREVGWAVTRAARYVPFRAVCLPQAIAAQAMLRRRGVASVMHFGVATHKNAPMDAHAWLDVGEIEVTGFPVRDDFVELVRFV